MCRMLGVWLIALSLLSSPAFAEVGTLSGTVTDETGSPLPGVTVTAISQGQLAERAAVTDAEGRFVLRDLPLATYSLIFTLDGFSEVRFDEIEVSFGEQRELNVEMTGGAFETITVTSHSSAVAVRRSDEICYPAVALEYRPICTLGRAGYAFNVPPGLHYLESTDIHLRLDPEEVALRVQEVVEDLGLRGAVEAGTTRWSRCMEAELVETTIDSPLRARPVERNKLTIHPLVENGDGTAWVGVASTGAGAGSTETEIAVKKMGLHPVEWRWRITGVRPGRTQLALRLYAVSVLDSSEPGNPICAPRESATSDRGRRRVQTLQRRLAIEVSTARWLDARLPTPWLWSLVLAPVGVVLMWWRRERGKRDRPSTRRG